MLHTSRNGNYCLSFVFCILLRCPKKKKDSSLASNSTRKFLLGLAHTENSTVNHVNTHDVTVRGRFCSTAGEK